MYDLFNPRAAAMAGALLLTMSIEGVLSSIPVEAKTPGSTYCFVGKCHRVKSLSETESLIGKTIPLYASHYSDCKKDRYNPCGLTSSGEAFHPHRADNAASPIYPDGTVLLVRNPDTKAAAVLRINNAGPYWGNRKLDVSYAAAEKLGFRKRGVAKLETKILAAPNKREARYVRKRSYHALPGFMGTFESLEAAERTAVALMVLDATAASATVASSSAASVVAARTETKADKARKERGKKHLAPIVKSMNLIANLQATEANAAKIAEVTLNALGGRRKSDAIAVAAVLKEPKGAGSDLDPVAKASGVRPDKVSPRHSLAQAALLEIGEEFGAREVQKVSTAVMLIRTAEVGAPSKNDWEGLLRTRLGDVSLVGGRGGFDGDGGSPFRPLPGRAPRPEFPLTPNMVRYGLTG